MQETPPRVLSRTFRSWIRAEERMMFGEFGAQFEEELSAWPFGRCMWPFSDHQRRNSVEPLLRTSGLLG